MLARLMLPVAAALLVATGSSAMESATAAPAETWLTDYDQALKLAKKTDRIVFADFTGSDWCGWCIKLNSEVFSKKEFQAWARENAVLLEIDFPRQKSQDPKLKEQNLKLAKQFKVSGYPTIVFLDAEGNELGRSGYREGGPKKWVEHAEQVLAAARQSSSWNTSYEEALAKAKKTGRPILADFTGSDWCGWCVKLKGEVFDTEAFQAWAEKNVVLLELDFPRGKPQSEDLKKQNQDLLKKYGVEGFPTILFLDVKGNKIGEMGYLEGGPKVWLKSADQYVPKKRAS